MQKITSGSEFRMWSFQEIWQNQNSIHCPRVAKGELGNWGSPINRNAEIHIHEILSLLNGSINQFFSPLTLLQSLFVTIANRPTTKCHFLGGSDFCFTLKIFFLLYLMNFRFKANKNKIKFKAASGLSKKNSFKNMICVLNKISYMPNKVSLQEKYNS